MRYAREIMQERVQRVQGELGTDRDTEETAILSRPLCIKTPQISVSPIESCFATVKATQNSGSKDRLAYF